jgi:hypothetical protein
MNLRRPRRLLHCEVLERLRVQAPSPQAVCGIEGDRGEPSARIVRDRAALERALRIQERRLYHVFRILMVVQFALDQPDQPGAVLPIQSLDLGGHI